MGVRSVCEGRDVRRRFDAVRSSEMDEVREILVECLSCLLGYRGVLCSFYTNSIRGYAFKTSFGSNQNYGT